MISIAIIGFGNHVEKNILPALEKIKGVNVEAVYVRDTKKYAESARARLLTIKKVSELNLTDAEWVYVSTPIASHYEYVKQAIAIGKHVICEKTLTDSLEQAKELFELAKQQKCQLHEVCMYIHHKQYAFLKELVDELGARIRKVHAKFTIPHLTSTDIRYQKSLGGGALLDVGYYPVSIIVNLFGTPHRTVSLKKSEPGFEVDLTGSAIFEYEHFYGIAEWGIGLPYANELAIETNDSKYTFGRIFSKPGILKTSVEITKGFEKETLDIGEDDQFVNFFKDKLFFNTKMTFPNTVEILKVISSISGS